MRWSDKILCANAIRGWRQSIQDDSGQALVESAVTLVVTRSLIFTIMTVCLLMYSYGLICETAREGARYACTHGANCVDANGASCTLTADQINTYTKSSTSMPNLGGGTLTAQASYPSGNNTPGSLVQVTVTYQFPLTIPLVSGSLNNVPLSTTSRMTILQ